MTNLRKLWLTVWLIGIFLSLYPTISNAQKMPVLDKKYQRLELKLNPTIKSRIIKLRKTGLEKKWTFQVGSTSVADLKFDNAKLITGAKASVTNNNESPNSNNTASVTGTRNLNINARSRKVDLRTQGLVSSVRNQRGCGSCWAFCATACIETAHIITNGANPSTIDLSEQFVLSCSRAGSCDGGYPHEVFKYFKNSQKGQPLDNTFRYTATDLACQRSPRYSKYKVANWSKISGGQANVQEVKAALARYGAVESYIWVNTSFRYYTNGVINDNNRSGWGGWHCVQIVGWDDAKQAYLIKNSWGTNWGMNGFAWVKYNVLSMGKNASWVTAKEFVNELAVLELGNNTLTTKNVLGSTERIGGWNFNPKDNRIKGIGDFNGDGVDDFVVTSPWGIGVLTATSNGGWRALMMKPKGTRFGGWLYNPKDNVVRGVGDFNGDNKADILITSPWGIGILTLSGNTLRSVMMKPKGTRFGGWLYNPKDNRIKGIGDFNGDKKDDILVTSPWGIGMLKLSGNTLSTIMLKPKGTRFGGWNYNPADNRIQKIGDFNGDRKDDILITSPWGIGMLTQSGSSMTALMMKKNGTRFGGWNFQSKDNRIRGVGDFNGDNKDDIVVTSPWGIGILKLSGNTMAAIMMKKNGTRFGGWNFQSKDNSIRQIGDFNGDNKDDILITSPWGIGVLTVSGTSMRALMLKPKGTSLGGWKYNTRDIISGVGTLSSRGRKARILIMSR